MKQRPGIYYSEEQKLLMWDHWKKGESPGSIAKLFDRQHSAVTRIIGESAGIRPASRHCSSRCLSLDEREEISRAVVVL